MATADRLQSETLTAALDAAIAGRRDKLYRELEITSGLPGPRMNENLAQAFANECAARGKKVDDLVRIMAKMTPAQAPGASSKEFLPVCGILALGARAAKDRTLRKDALELLHDRADDPRFRVREAVPLALARIGSAMGDILGDEVEHWMDGFHHAAAVVHALGQKEWLDRCDYYVVINRLQDAWLLVRDAPRSAARYPGRKELVEALSVVPVLVAQRFPLPMTDRLGIWAEDGEDPAMTGILKRVLDDERMRGRLSGILEEVHKSLSRAQKPPRDPSRIVKGTRGRGRKRR